MMRVGSHHSRSKTNFWSFFFNFKASWLDYKYIYLKNDRYCKYRDFTIIPDCARWRMIFVRETDDNEDLLSRVIFCTKQWPDRFLYLDKSQRFANSQRSHNEMLVYGKIGALM